MNAIRLREALRQQGIFVHENDPVLEVAEIARLAVAETLSTIEGVNKATADRISAASVQHAEAAKQAAAALINRAGEWSAETLRAAAHDVADDLTLRIRAEVARAQQATQAAEQKARTATRAARLSVMMVVVMGCGIAGFFVALDLGWF